MATSNNLGRVQGGGFFGSSSTSTTTIEKTTVQTNGSISPLVGDTIVNANGDLCKITAITSSAYTVTKYGSIKGATGANGTNGKDGKDAADFSDVNFATSDWERIMDVIMAGKAAEVFSLTDKRKFQFGNGDELELSILDLNGNHDVMSANASTPKPNGFAPITLGVLVGLTDYYHYGGLVEGGGQCDSGWESSVLRTETMQTIYDLMPAEIKKYIVPVIKMTMQGGKSDSTKIVKTVEYCFPFAAVELTGDCVHRVVTGGLNVSYPLNYNDEDQYLLFEGTQYDYFKAVKDGENPSGRIFPPWDWPSGSDWYYLRSYATISKVRQYPTILNADGEIYNISSYGGSDQECNLVFGFCVART